MTYAEFLKLILSFLLQADANLDMEERELCQASLQYVFLLQEVEERKKFEFVETVNMYTLLPLLVSAEARL